MTITSSRRHLYVIVLAGVSLLVAAAGWLLLIGPQRQHAASAAGQVRQTQAELALITAAAKAPKHPQQPPIRTKALYALETAMPVTENEPDLLLALDQLASSFGVRVTSISPATPSAAVGYTILPVSLSLSGTYSSLTHFVRRLRTLVSVRHHQVVASGRLFAVTSVALAPGNGNKLTASVALQAFVYGSVAGTTPLPSTTGSTSTNTTTTSGQ